MLIDDLREKCDDKTIEVTSHMLMRLQQRGIKYAEVKSIIMSGEIIEDYPNDYPYPSCLILGWTEQGIPLHVVAGLGASKLWLITAYKPDKDQWSNDFKNRKA